MAIFGPMIVIKGAIFSKGVTGGPQSHDLLLIQGIEKQKKRNKKEVFLMIVFRVLFCRGYSFFSFFKRGHLQKCLENLVQSLTYTLINNIIA